MKDAVRVTVIATGIKPEKMGMKARGAYSPTVRSVQQTVKNVMMKKERLPIETATVAPPPVTTEIPDDDLDVPAFMRRKKP
jgi:hypothetical protein